MKEMEDIESHPCVVPRSHFEYQTLARVLEQSSRALGARRRRGKKEEKGSGLQRVV